MSNNIASSKAPANGNDAGFKRRGDERLSTVLIPMDDTHARAHELIRCPNCSLIGR